MQIFFMDMDKVSNERTPILKDLLLYKFLIEGKQKKNEFKERVRDKEIERRKGSKERLFRESFIL